MPDSVTQGQFRKFLIKIRFVPKGRNKNLHVGVFNGAPRVLTFHFHKDSKIIPSGTLSAIARQLGINKKELIDIIKGR